MGKYTAQSPAQKAARRKQSENWRNHMRSFGKGQRLFEPNELDKQPNVVRDIVRGSVTLDEDDQALVEEIRGQTSSD